MIGQTVSHYTIIKKLGEGGMGEVYLAKDSKLERNVALKFLSQHYTQDIEANARFQREAKAAAALNHPNIITIHEIGEHEGRAYIAMEYIDGQSLREVVDKSELQINRIIDIFSQICEGLAKAHQAGIVHRDLKPENIMIDAAGTVKILDFGLAQMKGKSKLTSNTATMGTLSYMSPEQIEGDNVDHRTDLWAVGVMLYEMVAGRLPFDSEYHQAVIYSIMAEQPAPLARYKTGVTVSLQDIVDKALDKDRDTRYQNITDMLADLNGFKKSPAVETKTVRLKNVHRNRHVFYRLGLALTFLLVFSGLVYFWLASVRNEANSKNGMNENRIAVLPFDNLSANAEFEYFADGITEELISTMSRLDELRVIARASVMRYKNLEKNISEIGKTLNVTVLLDGSVRISGEQLRISVQLIDVATEENLWSKTYNRKFRDVFAIQGDIAQNIADTLKIHLLENDKQQINKEATENLEAYTLYLKGRFNWNKRTPATLQKSISYFEQSIEKDSLFALAYSGLADAYALLGSVEYGVQPPTQVMPSARAMAKKAIALDETLVEAYTSLANITLFYDWEWKEAERLFKHALSINRNYATTHHWYATYLMFMGRTQEAISEINRALELDPLSLVINTDAGWFSYYSRDYEKARQSIEKTLELDPSFIQAYLALGLINLQLNKHKQGIEIFKKAKKLSDSSQITIALLGYAYALSGEKNKAREELETLKKLANSHYVAPLYFALLYLGLREIDQTLYWMEQAYQEKSGYFVYFHLDPKLDSLRANSKFLELMKKVRFNKKGD